MVTCQLTYLPLFTEEVIAEVDRVIAFLDDYDVDYTVGALSTTLTGEREEVFRLLEDLYRSRDMEDRRFRIHIELLNSNDYS